MIDEYHSVHPINLKKKCARLVYGYKGDRWGQYVPKKITHSEDNELLFQVKVSFHVFPVCLHCEFYECLNASHVATPFWISLLISLVFCKAASIVPRPMPTVFKSLSCLWSTYFGNLHLTISKDNHALIVFCIDSLLSWLQQL